jgi:hypothetical protein
VDPLPPTEDDTRAGAAAVIPIRRSGLGDDQARSAADRRSGHRRPTPPPQTAVTLLIAAAAGFAGGVASGAPTGLTPLDVAVKSLLPAACVLAGRRTPWPFVALAAVTAAAGSYRSPAALVAVVALGLTLGGWRTAIQQNSLDRSESYQFLSSGRAAVCGSLADIAIRATWPRPALAPSALAAVIVLLILVPAVVVAPPQVRRLVVRSSALVVLAALLLCGLAGFSILQARSPLRLALAATSRGLKYAEADNQAQAIAQFKKADTALRTADSDLDWAAAAEVVPVLSQQVRAIRTAASVGTSLVQAGVSTASSANVQGLSLVDGTFPVGRLESFQPLFRTDVAILNEVHREIGPFSSPWVVGPLRAKLQSEQSKLEEAQHDAGIALLGSEEVPGILGAHGIRRYLLLVENPAESRASGGVIGDYAEVTADAGRLKLVKVGSVEHLDSDGVPPLKRTLPPIPDFVDRYSSFFPQDHWENISMSPDFPTVGAVAEYLYPQSSGVKVNGVISLDPVAMAGLLKITGPVKTKALEQELTSGNIVPFLANQEFIDFKKDSVRIPFVEGLLKQVWRELTSRRLPPAPSLVKDLGPAVKGGHFRMYSTLPAEETFFNDVHIGGAMPPVVGDFVGVVTQNAAGNKMDWYIRRKIVYDATLNLAKRTITSTLTLTLHNSSPSSGLPPEVIDAVHGITTKPGEDLIWVNIYSPWPLASATVNGKRVTMTSQYELGRPVYGAIVPIRSDSTAVLELHLSGTWPSSLSHYSLGWYHQPVLFPDQVSTKLTVIH